MIPVGKTGPTYQDHRREAARLRLLAASATTAMKARLLEQARHEDWLASIEPSGEDTQIRSTATS
jgi:hypothetical protein